MEAILELLTHLASIQEDDDDSCMIREIYLDYKAGNMTVSDVAERIHRNYMDKWNV